jgi:hypothetical protein
MAQGNSATERHWPAGTAADGASILIDCDRCVMRRTGACRDCVMTFLLATDERPAHQAVVIDADEQRALRLFASRGLTPTLRHQCRRADHPS